MCFSGAGERPSMPNAVRDSRVMVPQLPPRHIPRTRLLAELDIAADLPLTLLSAEPRRFWRLLECALREANGGERGPPIAPARGAGVDLVQTLLSRLPDPGRLVVIVDDAHVLTHSDVLEGLDSLVRGWQPGLRLILASRSDPLLPLHRYRLAGQMHELRACDLAMTPAEITEVLAIHGVTLPARDFDLFVARTEGWVAGVRLSAMRMAGTGYPADLVSELALDPGSIGEYLTNEVLYRQPEPQRRLLIETSFLEAVTGPLADAVTGMTGCGDMLASLARENSFVI